MSAWELLVRAFPGWTLTEIKELSLRERRHWVRRALWEAERR
jgi:hypothetical protein